KSELEDTFDSQTKGVALGVEKNMAENTKVGIGYAYSQTEIDGLHRSTDVDTHTAFLYAEYKPSNWYLNAIATYGMSDYAENKNVSSVVVNADYDAQTYGLQLLSGYDMQVGGFGFTPETGLRYVHIEQDSYTDTAKQNVSSNNNDILTGIIGAKINKTIKLNNQAYITPEVRVAATYDMINDDASSVVTLANGSAYTVNGESLKKFGLEFGTAVTAQINDNFNFSLGYEGKFKKDYQDHTGLLNAKYNF
ncbi:MAG: autotransporter outer membrane beta-barrel domain-containing protein, partial [Alphaproteobacteria bacterium]|nr:autotransporter outer membrane beta-barrel domain-containing protein [Alphaproteobacteria bacterium]